MQPVQSTANTNIEERWKAFITHIKASIPDTEFNNWFSDLHIEHEDTRLTINVPYVWHTEYICNNYMSELKSFITNNDADNISIDFSSECDNIKNQVVSKKKTANRLIRIPSKFNQQITADSSQTFSSFKAFADTNSIVKRILENSLKNKVNGLEIITVCGGHGLGKTHLMNAMINVHVVKYPSKRRSFISSKDFFKFVQNDTFKDFLDLKKFLADHDLFIIDDFHHFKNSKENTEIFCNLLDWLSFKKVNIKFVLSSDIDMSNLEISQKLKSRLSSGINLKLSVPQQSDIKEIIKAVSEKKDISLDSSSIDHLSSACSGDARQIIGYINTIKMLKSQDSGEIMELIQKITYSNRARTIISSSNQDLPTTIILDEIAKYFGLSVKKILILNTNACSHARAIAMYLDKEFNPKKTTKIIGNSFGKSHSTVVRACQNIKSFIDTNTEAKTTLKAIKDLITKNHLE